jgi:subtilisin family serine protease
MITDKLKVKTETRFVYTNKFSNKKLSFKPKPDEVMATFIPNTGESDAQDVMNATKMAMSRSLDLERGFAVFQVSTDSDTSEASDTLTRQNNVANTVPVMEDDEGLTRYFMPDEFTVQFTDSVNAEAAERLLAEMKCNIVEKQRTPGYYTVTVPEDKGLFETLQTFSERDDVAFAEPSEVGFDDELYYPPDTEFPKLWGLHNTGQTVNGASGAIDADIDAPHAWDLEQGNRDVIVAVIDTGCDMDHPDLLGNLLPRGTQDWDFADPHDESPDDSGTHGTHVCGTVGAVDNSSGVIGVAPRCRLMPLRVNLFSGFNANRADAINYVATQASAHPEMRYVINCSWKMSGDHAGVHNAIINAVNSNVVVCFAAGNANSNIDNTPQYPAVYSEVIAVAATDQQDVRAWFSNYGSKVDVSAPGVNIYSTIPNNSFGFKDGTSMASPHVAGLAALIWSHNPDLNNAEVRKIIENSCVNIDAKNPGYEGLMGKGRINAYRALSITPQPTISYSLVRKFEFPQKSSGSSSALAIGRKRIGWWTRTVLMFLTQKPGSERIYFLHPTMGRTLSSVDPIKNETIGSMEWDGTNILVANVTSGSGSINLVNPDTGAQVSSITAPAGRGEGMAYDGTYIYYSTINLVHVIRKSDGALIRSFPPPGGACRSLAYGQGYLFSGNSSTGLITVFNPNTLVVRGTIPAPGGGSNQVEGLAFRSSSNYLYIANQSENTIYMLRVKL